MAILMERYPFSPDIATLAWVGGLAGLVILSGSLIPPVLAYRIPASRALRFTGLSGVGRGGLLRGKARLVYHVRRMLSRPWMTFFLVAFITLAWGAAASIPMSVRGTNVIGEEIARYGYDASIIVTVQDPGDVSSLPSIAGSAGGVVDAEVWASEWRAVKFMGEDLMLSSCIEGSWRLGPPLSVGRWPGRGEMVVSETLAKLYDLRVGDTVRLEKTVGGAIELRVVGIAETHSNNGRIAYISKSDYLGVSNANHVFLRVKTIGDPDEAALEVKNLLLEHGLPSRIMTTKESMLQQHRENLGFLKMFLTIINASTLVGGFAGLAVLVLVDLAGRLRELGVLRAIGFSDWELSLTVASDVLLASLIAAPFAYFSGMLISSVMLGLMRDAMGYVEPAPRLSDLLSSGWILASSLIIAYLSSLVYLRRQSTADLLRVE